MAIIGSLGRTATGFRLPVTGGGVVAPSYAAPYNLFYEEMGDSRTAENGVGGNGDLGVTGTGYKNNLNSVQPSAWLLPLINNRLTQAPSSSPTSNTTRGTINNGIGSQATNQILAIPRLQAPATDAFAADKGVAAFAARQANILFMLMGTNDIDYTPGNVNGQALSDKIAYLTTTGPGAPLYNNEPKFLIIFNEIPRGGPYATGTTTDRDLSAWAAFVSSFDALSGSPNANPRVMVIDTYNSALIRDYAATPNTRAKDGSLYDNLHKAPYAAKAMADVAATKVNAWLDGFGTQPIFAPATTATQGNFISPNPLLAVGTPGTSSATGLSGDPLPGSGFITISAGLSVVVSYTTAPGIDGRILVLTITGALTTSGAIQYYHRLASTGLITIGTDKLRVAGHVGATIGSGSTMTGCSLATSIISTSGASYAASTNARESSGNVGALTRWLRQGTVDSSFALQPMVTPILDLTLTGSGGAQVANGQANIGNTGGGGIRSQLLINYNAPASGTANFTDVVYLAGFGMAKVTL